MIYVQTVDIRTSPAMHLKVGQWVETHRGKGQVVALRDGKAIVSHLKPKGTESFNDRTQRFARAVWYNKGGDVGQKVANAPFSLTVEKLKKRLGLI